MESFGLISSLALAEPRLEINPNDSMMLSAVATYHAALGDAKNTDETIEKLLAMNSDDVYIVYDIARASARLGREDDTRKYLTQLISQGYSETLLSRDANFDGIDLREKKESK